MRRPSEPRRTAHRPAAMRTLRRAGVLVFAIMLASMAVACAGPAASGALVSVEVRGGECAGSPCGSTVSLDRDGRVHAAAKPPNDLGVVPGAQVQALQAAILATDFATLAARPFTGDCPTAYDGQEYVVTFATPSGTQRIASCQVEVDWGQPLFVALSAALGPFIPLPTA